MSTLSLDPADAPQRRDFMPLHGIDHIELWVGNAAQAAYHLRHAFGFTEVAYAGLETGLRDRVSHVLQQGRIRLVLTGTLGVGSEIAAQPVTFASEVHPVVANSTSKKARVVPRGWSSNA